MYRHKLVQLSVFFIGVIGCLMGWYHVSNGTKFPGVITLSTVMNNRSVMYISYGDTRNLIPLEGDTRRSSHPMLSPDKQRIAYICGAPTRLICLMSIDGSQSTTLDETQDVVSLNWSPDSTSLVFSINQTGISEVYRIRVDGTDKTQLTFHSNGSHDPAWSPDNQYIVYSNRGVLYRMKTDGSEQQRLGEAGIISDYPAWAPDGSQFVYSAYDHTTLNRNLYIRDSNGMNIVQLTDDIYDEYHPIWSHDSRLIMFIMSKYDTFHLYIMNADGTNQRELLMMENDISALSWVQ